MVIVLVGFSGWDQSVGSLAALAQQNDGLDGPSSFARGRELFQQAQYDEAASELWKAVLLHSNTPPDRQYDVQECFQLFLQCYHVQGKVTDGFAFVASESFRRGQIEMGKNYLQQALEMDPNNEAAQAVQREFAAYIETSSMGNDTSASAAQQEDEQFNQDLIGKTPEEPLCNGLPPFQ